MRHRPELVPRQAAPRPSDAGGAAARRSEPVDSTRARQATPGRLDRETAAATGRLPEVGHGFVEGGVRVVVEDLVELLTGLHPLDQTRLRALGGELAEAVGDRAHR